MQWPYPPTKPQQNPVCMRRGGGIGGTVKNSTNGDYEFASSSDPHQQEFYKSFDLSPLMFGSTLFGDPTNFPMEFQNISDNEIGTGCLGKETKKRCFREMEMSKYDISTDVDLELRLSPPGVSFMAKSSKALPLSSQETSTSLDLNSSDYLDNSFRVEVPSLSLMGCTVCLIYAMVSEADPKCPKCKRSFLIDMFRDNIAKRCRKSYFASSNTNLCIFKTS